MHFDYIFCKSQTTFHNTSYSPILAHVKNMVWAQAFLLHQYLRNPESSWVNTTHWVNKEIITPHISKWFQDTINKWKPLKANTVAWTITKVWKKKQNNSLPWPDWKGLSPTQDHSIKLGEVDTLPIALKPTQRVKKSEDRKEYHPKKRTR